MFQKNESQANVQKILVIDEGVLDSEILLVDLQADFKVVRLSSNLDPITQISQTLSTHALVSEITILAHAQPGQINFSDHPLDLATLNNREQEFIHWCQWLTADAKICIYACSLASGEIGQEFLYTLKSLTGAEIASSSLPIGKIGAKHNWSLDQFTQPFEVLMPFNECAVSKYQHILADPLLVSSIPSDDSIDFPVNSDIQLSFDENVTAGSGNIVISNGSDTRTIDINDASQVTFAGSKVIVNPVNDLIQNTSYNIQMTSGVITDTEGNAYVGISDLTTLNFTTIPTAPILFFSTPSDESSFKIDNDVQLFFNGIVTAGSGNIVISNGSDTRTIDINDTSQVMFNGSRVIVSLVDDLIPNASYNIQIDSGAIINTAGNTYAGISDPTTLNFTTISSDPLPSGTNPSDQSSFQIDHDIRLFFDENVTAGSGNIVISNGFDTRAIDINDASQVTFNGDEVTVNPINDLFPNASYNIQMASGVITDTAGNVYAGISDPTTLNFTTIPTDPLLTFDTNPSDESSFQVDHNIELIFNEAVAEGSGNIVISNGFDTRTIDINDTSQVTFSGSKVTVNPTDDLIPNTSYNVQMASGVITDAAGNVYAGISDPTTLNFTTIPTEPLLFFSTPSDESSFKIDNDIQLSFNEDVTAGSGNIVISNGSDTRTININDFSQITFSNNSVFINPTADFIPNTSYNIQIASGVITDTAGNAYAGISDPTELNFTTISGNPLLSSSNPSDDSIDFPVNSDIQLSFDENVIAGSGNIVISNGSDTRTIDINDTSQVTFSKGKVTVNPADDLIQNTSYNIQIASGVITDTAGNVYAGISDPTVLNFETIQVNEPDISLISGLGGAAGFGEQLLPRNDDSSTGFIDISSIFEGGIDFFGRQFTGLWVNNNGSVTFNGPRSTFTPNVITENSGNPEITPYFADVDTGGGAVSPTPGGNSTGSNLVYYDFDAINDRFIVTWDDVGYFSSHTDKLNAFQLILTDRSNGDFDIEFRYEDVNWTTGDFSGGSGGLGGSVARAGYTAGTGDPAAFFELPTSGDQNAMLALDETQGNTGDIGRWEFKVRSGDVVTSDIPPLPPIGTNGWINGDPHISTLDGVGYDFQATGEYVLLHGTVDPSFEIQGRMLPIGNDVSIISAVATNLDGTAVMVDAQDAIPLQIGGVATTIDNFSFIDVGNDRVFREDDTYTIVYAGADGIVNAGDSRLTVDVRGERVDIDVRLNTEMAGNLEGLFGDGDGNAANDIAMADGTVLERPLSFDVLYGQYRDDWRVSDIADSLFTYDTGESLAGFYQSAYPGNLVTLDDLEPSFRAAAEQAVLDAGLSPGTANYNNAVLDFALTGDTSFIASALDAPRISESNVVSVTPPEPPQFNVILGTIGRDVLNGTGNDDLIKSLGGNVDRMTGGEGGDIFVFGAETTNGVRERDIILDYEVGIDSIQLEDGATVGSIRQTSSGVTVFFEGDRDAVFVQGEGVLVGNLTFVPEDILLG